MKRTSFLFFLLVASLIPGQVWGIEKIHSYITDITVHQNGELTVAEQIVVNAERNQIKRGIFRDFPTNYRDRMGHKMNVGFEVIKVMRNGQPERHQIKPYKNGIRVKIGDPDRFVNQGRHTYLLIYKTNRQLGFYEDHDELYFNAIGHGWNFPIVSGKAVVNLPFDVRVQKIGMKAFAGPYGAKGGDVSTRIDEEGRIHFQVARELSPKEGLSIVVTWPKGLVEAPTTASNMRYFLRDNVSSVIGILGLLLVGLYYYWAWLKVGVDPEVGTIIPRWEPPQGLTPYGMRYVSKMSFDRKCLACAITEMALKGGMKISETAGSYTLEKQEEGFQNLSGNEKGILIDLMGADTSLELTPENHAKVQRALKRLKKKMQTRHLNKTFFENTKEWSIGILISVGVIVLMFGSEAPDIALAFNITNFSIVGLLVLQIILYKFWIKAPSIEGRRVMDEIDGYKMYLETAERERLNRKEAMEITPEIYEYHLPFAMALGVEEVWSRIFADSLARMGQKLDSYQPTWYYGSRPWYSRGAFSSSIATNLSTAISASATPPGSSSGSGGGGFSGGGGGGGGGGGW